MTSTDILSTPAETHQNNRTAVALILAFATFAAGSITSLLASHYSAKQAELTAGAELHSELNFRKDRVIDYLDDVESNLAGIASSRIAASITGEFVDALKEDGGKGYANMRRAYISDNPNPPGRKQALVYANDNSQYSRVHARYHDWLLSISTAHDYYDFFLTDANGNIVYSVFKEDDFGTSLEKGKYRDTALATTFKRVRENRISTEAIFSDFAAYAPSDNLPAAFVGTPIMRDGQFAGAIIAQLKHSRLNTLIKANNPSVDKHQVFLAGTDAQLRAGSGFASDEVLQIAYDKQSVEAALSNRTGITETTGILGNNVVAAYAPMRWNGVGWALIVELDKNNVDSSVKTLRAILAMSVLLCSTLAFVAGWLLADHPDDTY